MKLTKNQFFNLIGYLVVVIILIGILKIAFWELNIFKKEEPLPSDVLGIKNEIDFIKSLKLSEIGARVHQMLPSPKTLEIPQINPTEIGKNNLFE